MSQKEYRRLVALAREKDPIELDRLWHVFCGTDMPEREFLAHLRIIAEGD